MGTSKLTPSRSSLGLIAMTLLSGCGVGQVAQSLAKPPTWTAGQQAKCSVAASRLDPLIIEWPSADRARLEALIKDRSVAVRYVGCDIEVLPMCSGPGTYRYVGTTRKTDQEKIQNADDLYAKLPLGAARLESTLSRAGQLSVGMSIVGRFERVERTVSTKELTGDCDRATHVVTALTVGAFEFATGASASVKAGGEVFGAGAGGGSSSNREVLSRDGMEESCEKATPDDPKPPAGCGALLRIELAALPELAARHADDERKAAEELAAKEEGKSTRRLVGYIVAGAGLAFGASAGAFALLGKGTNSDIQSGDLPTRDDVTTRASTGASYNTLGYVSLVAAVVSLGIGVPLILFNQSERAPATAGASGPGFTTAGR